MPLIIPGNSQASTGFTIDQSIRFNGVDTPQLTRTPSSGGNQDKWTFSCWVKRGKFGQSGGGGSHQVFLSAGNDVNNFTFFGFRDSGSLPSGGVAESLNLVGSVGGSTPFELSTTQVFRDPSAWSHIVGVYDSGNSVSSERCRVYVNGSRITEFNVETYPSQNQDSDVNESGVVQRVGAFNLGGNKGHLDGYMAEIVLIDGQALDPSSFGEYNSSNIWVPKDVSGLTFGTNGFHIKGQDSSDLGNDSSGNNNDYTTSGLASHDQMADSPTNNYAVMNPLDTHSTPNWTLSNGNLDVVWSGANYVNSLFSTLSMPATGKWYFEIEFDAESGSIITNQTMRIGLMREDINAAYTQANSSVDLTNGATTPEILVILGNAGNAPQLKGMGSTINNVVGSMSAGDRINFARNGANLWVGRNGTYYNSGNPATGSNPSLSNLQLQGYRANLHFTNSNSDSITLKAYFGSDKSIGSGTGFNDTVPSGFKALNTVNLGEA